MPILIQIVCLTMLSVTQNIASNDRMAVNNVLKGNDRMAVNNVLKGKSKKVVDAYLKPQSRHLSGGTENIYKIRLG
jgi:hypothetical protein